MADLSIQDVRSKYPQYSDMSDQQLADALHSKYYSDMPVDDFYKKIGINKSNQTTPTQPQRRSPTPEQMARLTDPWFKGLIETPMALGTGAVGSTLGGIAQIGTSAYEGGRELLGGEQTQRPIEDGRQLGSAAEEVGTEVGQKFSFEPESKLGKTLTGAAGQVMSGFGALPWLKEKIREGERGLTGGRTYLTDTAFGALAAAPVITSTFTKLREGSITEKQAKLDIQKKMNFEKDAIRDALQKKDVNKLQYITPAEEGVSLAAAKIAPAVNERISIHNSEVAVPKVSSELGMDIEKPLTEANISARKEVANNAYDAVKNTIKSLSPSGKGKVVMEKAKFKVSKDSYGNPVYEPQNVAAELQKRIADTYKLYESNKAEYADLNAKGGAIDVLKTELANVSKDPDIIMDRIRKLRSDAKTMGRSTDNVGAQNNARTKMFLANQLENLIEENLQRTGSVKVLDDFKKARTDLAKLHVVEESVSRDGTKIDLNHVASIGQKTKLTGELKNMADLASQYPKGSRNIVTPPGGISYFDTVLLTTSLAAGYGEGAALVGGRALLGFAKKGMQKKTPDYIAKRTAGTTAADIATGVAATQAETERKRRKQERAK